MSSSFIENAFSQLNVLRDGSSVLLLIGVLTATLYFAISGGSKTEKDIYDLGGLSVMTGWAFFVRRYDFLKSNFAKTGQKIYSFKVLQHSVVAMRGEALRKVFFDNSSLDFGQGYKILMGGAPRVQDLNVAQEQVQATGYNRLLLSVMSKERLSDVLPTLFDDLQAHLERLGKEGRLDPFKEIYDIVFQMTVRMTSCRELASDITAVAKLLEDFTTLEKSATPLALLLPWFRGAASKNRETANKSLYITLYRYVEMRKQAATPNSDAIDFLLSAGLNTDAIIRFILATVFAGVLQTGVSASWCLVHLSFNKEWKQKVIAEIHTIIQNHTNTTSADPLHKRLAAVPISAWEEDMPVLDLVIRETLRITISGTALRRNVDQDMDVTGKRLLKGSFIAYQLADAHLNPEIYTEPMQFDPTRFGAGREEDKKEAYAFLGWGAGRHPCAGMKIAKLEIKIIVALFLAGYEYDPVNEKGELPLQTPHVDYNDIHQYRPVGDPCYFKFRRTVD